MPDAPSDKDAATLQQLLGELAEARKQIGTLVAIVGQQAQAAPAQKQTTIAELYGAYEKVRGADTSWPEIRNKLRPLVRRLGSRRVCELTPIVWAGHVAVRKTEITSRDRPPADHTLNIELGRAKEMIDWGVAHGFADVNALRLAKKIKTISARETFLTEPQIQELLAGISDLPTMHAQLITRAFILCCLDGMLRLNEARHLRRDRIGKDGKVDLSAKKTKSRKKRVVALTPRALQAIEEIPQALGTNYVFANPETGKPYGVTAISAWFRVACIASRIDRYAADGERVTIHTLRHSGASAADRRGASLRAIQEALGHASVSTTAKYVHRHSEESALELAKLIAEGAEEERRRGPQRSDPHIAAHAINKVNGKQK